MRTVVLAVVGCMAAFSQNADTASGLMSEWDVKDMLSNLQTRAEQLGPVLDRMRPDMWATNGAPAAYAQQLTTAKNEVQYLVGSAQALNRDPERLTVALEALFRLQALDRTLGSLVDVARKYQSASLADTLQARLGDASVSRDKLRQYVSELAREKEHEYQVMDSEAQRCRGSLAGAGSTRRGGASRETMQK